MLVPAIIEMAEASGLALVPVEKRNPLITTSYGTGELMRKALEAGCKRIIVGIGGSATNDGGAGPVGLDEAMARAGEMLREASSRAMRLLLMLRGRKLARKIHRNLTGNTGGFFACRPLKI